MEVESLRVCGFISTPGYTPLLVETASILCRLQAGVAVEQVNQFKQAWMAHAYVYTKEYTSIYAGQLVDLLRELPPPLGIGTEGSHYDCQILAKKV